MIYFRQKISRLTVLWIGIITWGFLCSPNQAISLESSSETRQTSSGEASNKNTTPYNSSNTSFTLAVLPDTQHYYDIAKHRLAHIFMSQTQWVRDHVFDRNIAFLIHLGDVVQGLDDYMFQSAQEAMNLLDGIVPYALTVGNHDFSFSLPGFSRPTDKFNRYFPVKKFQSWPSFGGVFEFGKTENSFHYFSVGARKYLVLGLEYFPRDEVLDWANQIVSRHPEFQTIVFTHGHIYHDDDFMGPIADPDLKAMIKRENSEGKLNFGKAIWEKFLSQHKNIFLVLNGHIIHNKTRGKDGVGRLVKTGKQGNPVFQIGANYQQIQNGGNGYLRLMEFSPDGKKISVTTYSPFLDSYKTDSKNQFTIDLVDAKFSN